MLWQNWANSKALLNVYQTYLGVKVTNDNWKIICNPKSSFRTLNKIFLIFFWNNLKQHIQKRPEDKPGNNKPVKFSLVPGKVMEWVLSEHTSGCGKEKKVTGSSHHESTKGPSCLANLIASYDKMTLFQDEGQQ